MFGASLQHLAPQMTLAVAEPDAGTVKSMTIAVAPNANAVRTTTCRQLARLPSPAASAKRAGLRVRPPRAAPSKTRADRVLPKPGFVGGLQAASSAAQVGDKNRMFCCNRPFAVTRTRLVNGAGAIDQDL